MIDIARVTTAWFTFVTEITIIKNKQSPMSKAYTNCNHCYSVGLKQHFLNLFCLFNKKNTLKYFISLNHNLAAFKNVNISIAFLFLNVANPMNQPSVLKIYHTELMRVLNLSTQPADSYDRRHPKIGMQYLKEYSHIVYWLKFFTWSAKLLPLLLPSVHLQNSYKSN